MVMLTVAQVAERLLVKRDYVSRWIRSGKLPALDISSAQRSKHPKGSRQHRPAWRILESDLAAFIDANKTTSITTVPAPTPRRIRKAKQPSKRFA